VTTFPRAWLLTLTLTAAAALPAATLSGCGGGSSNNLAGKVQVAVCATAQHVCPCTIGSYCLANNAGCLAPDATCATTADLICQTTEQVCPCYSGAYCLPTTQTCAAPNAVCPVPLD
jgi:hypothetical protein